MAGQIYLNYLKILAGQGGEVVRVRQMRAAYLKYPFSGYLSPSTCYILIFVLFRISQPPLDILYFSGYFRPNLQCLDVLYLENIAISKRQNL